jgi:hypothetical protein
MDISTDWKSIYNTKYPTNTLHVEDDTSVTWINSMNNLSKITDPFVQIFLQQSANENNYILPQDPFGKCTEIDCTPTIPECYYFEHSNHIIPEDHWSNCDNGWNLTETYNSAWSTWSNCSLIEHLPDPDDCRFDRTRMKYSLCNVNCPTHVMTGAYRPCGINLQLNARCRKNPFDECGSNEFEHRLECSTNNGSIEWVPDEFSNATCQYKPIDCTLDLITSPPYSNYCNFGKTYIQLSEPKLFGGTCSNEGWIYQNPIYGSDTDFLDENSNLTLFGYSNIKNNVIVDPSENTLDIRISENNTSQVNFPYGYFHSNCLGRLFDLCTLNSHCENGFVCDITNHKCTINTGYNLETQELP